MLFLSFYSLASIRRISIEILLSVFRMSFLCDSLSLMHLTRLTYQMSGPFSELSAMNDSQQVKTKLDQSNYSCMVERV